MSPEDHHQVVKAAVAEALDAVRGWQNAEIVLAAFCSAAIPLLATELSELEMLKELRRLLQQPSSAP